MFGMFGTCAAVVIYILMQAQCWPNCMKSLGAWYPDRVRNSVFRMFGTCAFAGGHFLAVSIVMLDCSFRTGCGIVCLECALAGGIIWNDCTLQ